MPNHPDLFTFTDCFGGEIILDLSVIQYVQTKSNGEVRVFLPNDAAIFDFPAEAKKALITAWSHHRQRIYTTK